MDPIADPEATVQYPGLRVTVLTSRLLRIETSETSTFEDRASQVFLFRRLPVPTFVARKEENHLEIETDFLSFRYDILDHQAGVPTISVRLRKQNTDWHLGDPDLQNLLGTARTLDDIDGSVPLEKGLLARSGWSVVDDTSSLLFGDDGWLEPRNTGSSYQDLYFFGYGKDFKACIKDFYTISGLPPMPPRWAFGNWWSRYWPYTQDELLSLMDDFRAREVPLSVCVVDMDWHLVDIGGEVDGWTGYTWNEDLFPDPESFFDRLHAAGLKSCLNLHPALGIRPHEMQYDDFAGHLGLDPNSRQTIPFDIASIEFARAYLELLHHPHEEQGVDFWWIDWQQGEESRIPGLDPLWMLNHLHFNDLAREGRGQPVILSRWAGLGSHRYPVGFSGDTHATWESLAFQPYFTAAAANVGFGWWSHDIGGHMCGIEDPELFTRWIQYGVFSPIFRFHSTNNPFLERRPWMFGEEILRIAREAMQMRHAFIPYLYTMAWLNKENGQPMIRPMYHDYPGLKEAYICPQQYLFGDQLIAAPYVIPLDEDTGMSRQVIWLPPGGWYNFFTGEFFEGNSWQVFYGRLDETILFAQAGAIIPLGPMTGYGGIDNPSELNIHAFCEADGEFTLFEDGDHRLVQDHDLYCQTNYQLSCDERNVTFEIKLVQGKSHSCPRERRYQLHLHGVRNPESVDVQIEGDRATCDWVYNEHNEELIVKDLVAKPTVSLSVVVKATSASQAGHSSRLLERCRDQIRAFKLGSETKRAIDSELEAIISNPQRLLAYEVNLAESQLRALLEITTQAGMEQLDLYDHGKVLLLWNNTASHDVVFRYSFEDFTEWESTRRFSSASGIIPRSRMIEPKSRWKIAVTYFGHFSIVTSGRLTDLTR